MIDFHNHVLYDVDDGPKSIEESISMIHHAADQGVTDIVQTVHFQHPKMDGKNTQYDYLLDKINILQSAIDEDGLNIKMHLSAEVFYLPNLLEISSNPLLTIGNKKYMLIEFLTNINPRDYESQFYELQQSGITPIVAHPERYRFIQNDIEILDIWLDRGYLIQIDAGSILGHFGLNCKDVSLKMIHNNFVHLIGSDAHNNKKRNFCLKQAYDFLEKNKSIEFVEQLKDNSSRVLNGKFVENITPEVRPSDKKESLFSYLFKKRFKIGKL